MLACSLLNGRFIPVAFPEKEFLLLSDDNRLIISDDGEQTENRFFCQDSLVRTIGTFCSVFACT